MSPGNVSTGSGPTFGPFSTSLSNEMSNEFLDSQTSSLCSLG